MKKIVSLAACIALLVVVGCSQETPTTVPSTTATTSTVDGSKYLLAVEPDDAVDVIKVREDAEDQDEVVIVGRIGGSENPWVDGRAAFSIVDPSLKSCAECGSHDCPKPWDYCCSESGKLSSSTALIKVVDENGSLVKADTKRLLDLKELSTVVVKGKAQRDDAGNLTVLASGVYVKKK